MKKQSIFSLVALVAILAISSCNKYEAKKATLKDQSDSLNYTLGLTTGENIKMQFMQKDSSDKPVKALLTAIDKAYKQSSSNKSELYKIGTEIGNSFKQQKAKGLMGDSTLKFDEKLVRQGMINGLNGFKGGMTPQQAQEYLQKTMMKLQQAKMAQQQAQMPQQAPEQAPQQAPQQPAN